MYGHSRVAGIGSHSLMRRMISKDIKLAEGCSCRVTRFAHFEIRQSNH